MKYSKFLFFVCAVVLMLSNIDSKAGDPVKERVGIKGGVNFASLNSENSSGTNTTIGYNVGLFGKFGITEKIALQPELYYSRKGAEVSYNNTFANGTARYNLNYLELPVLLVANISKRFNVHAGPYGAFLLSGIVVNKSDVSMFNYEKNLSTSDFNRFDGGFAFGAGIDVDALSVGIRYNYGLTKVGKERNFLGYTYTYPDASNRVLNLYLSLSLN